jgi:hypothetical protein
VQEALGQYDKARASYEKAIRSAPRQPYTQVARDRLKGLAGKQPLKTEPVAASDQTPPFKAVNGRPAQIKGGNGIEKSKAPVKSASATD